jgi:hypothetical protein
MLRFEWRCELKRESINPANVFTRHTFFHTWQRVTDEGEVAELHMTPFSVVDRSRSAVIFNSDNRVIVVKDPTDYAMTPENRLESSEANWKVLEDLSKSDDFDQGRFNVRLRKSLEENPAFCLKRIFHTLAGPASTGHTGSALQGLLTAARAKGALTLGIDGATTAWIVDAIQTARQRLRRS